MSIVPADETAIAHAVEILRAGGLVGLPTETVYGLAADAGNQAAVRKMFAAKGRPADHPVIVHLADARQIADWAIDIPPAAHLLAARFWPGPLTLILKRAGHVLDAVTGGQDTVGLRVPSHPVAHALLARFGGGIAAPSANKFGRISPTSARHVLDEFGDAVELVLDGGACEVGIESTIVDCSGAVPRVLRPGSISAAMIAAALEPAGAANHGTVVPRVSGSLDAHYAPRTRALLVATDQIESTLRANRDKRIGLLSRMSPDFAPQWRWEAAGAAGAYAHALYATLRAMDAVGADLIVIEHPPQGADWEGVNDRLRRAAFGSGSRPDRGAPPR